MSWRRREKGQNNINRVLTYEIIKKYGSVGDRFPSKIHDHTSLREVGWVSSTQHYLSPVEPDISPIRQLLVTANI